ncbi:MAG: cytochrome c3 family protein [Deltaproteobacteria bacterium]|nr:cytochrome c3 family protein [Deltaproteobacteria bacterium]
MKTRLIAIILAVVVLGTGYYIWSQWSSYHNFSGQCMMCHLTEPTEKQERLLFTKDISSLCLTCHKDAVRISHPVGMKPTMEIPGDFLLDKKGKIACNTCHTTHNDGYGKYRLRVATIGEPFCRKCHLMLEDGSALHMGAIGSAHMGSSISAVYLPGSVGGYLDDLSIKCLMCHDASLGKDALVAKVKAGGEYDHGTNVGLSHPIGVSYIETSTKYPGAYKKVGQLKPEIRLFNGLVGCGSCHNPYSKGHFELVMSNEYSALCFACHNK